MTCLTPICEIIPIRDICRQMQLRKAPELYGRPKKKNKTAKNTRKGVKRIRRKLEKIQVLEAKKEPSVKQHPIYREMNEHEKFIQDQPHISKTGKGSDKSRRCSRMVGGAGVQMVRRHSVGRMRGGRCRLFMKDAGRQRGGESVRGKSTNGPTRPARALRPRKLPAARGAIGTSNLKKFTIQFPEGLSYLFSMSVCQE